MVLEQGNHFVDNLDIGKTATLRFANEFGIAPALGDEVVYVEHGEGCCSNVFVGYSCLNFTPNSEDATSRGQKRKKDWSRKPKRSSLSVESQNKNGGVRKVGSGAFARPWPLVLGGNGVHA